MPRLRPYLHVIPLEKKDHAGSSTRHGPGLLESFDTSSWSLRDSCARVIEQEAAQVNRRALQLKRSNPTKGAPSSKRRRTSLAPGSPELETTTPQHVELQEQSSRMMRMAVLLRNYEAIIEQLRPELASCVTGD